MIEKRFLVALIFLAILINSNLVSATLVPQENKTMAVGELWNLNDGYQVYVRNIEGEMDKADIALGLGNANLYEKWFSTGDSFNYPNVISSKIEINYQQTTGESTVTFTDLMLPGSEESSGSEPSTSGDTCTENWQCSLWTTCIDYTQRRRCIDLNNCDPTNNETIITRGCDSSGPDPQCKEDWVCTDWTTCLNNQQTRACIDQNDCSTTENRPSSERLCDSSGNEWDNAGDDSSSGSNDGSSSGNSGSSSSTVTYEYHYYITHPFASYFGFNVSDIPSDEFPPGPLGFFSPLVYLFLFYSLIFLLILLVVYIYTSAAFASIAKKTQPNHSPGLAWLPAIGPMLIARKAAETHWWPVLLIVLIFIPVINFLAGLALAVFFTIWMWKTFSRLNHPGWWSLFNIIPLLGNLVFLILLGIAAWSNPRPVADRSKKQRLKTRKV